jgi:hypothetical protein
LLSLGGQLIPAVTVKDDLQAAGASLQVGQTLKNVLGQDGGGMLAGNLEGTGEQF